MPNVIEVFNLTGFLACELRLLPKLLVWKTSTCKTGYEHIYHEPIYHEPTALTLTLLSKYTDTDKEYKANAMSMFGDIVLYGDDAWIVQLGLSWITDGCG